MLFLVLGVVGVAVAGAGAIKVANEAGWLKNPKGQYNNKPTPPRVGYS